MVILGILPKPHATSKATPRNVGGHPPQQCGPTISKEATAHNHLHFSDPTQTRPGGPRRTHWNDIDHQTAKVATSRSNRIESSTPHVVPLRNPLCDPRPSTSARATARVTTRRQTTAEADAERPVGANRLAIQRPQSARDFQLIELAPGVLRRRIMLYTLPYRIALVASSSPRFNTLLHPEQEVIAHGSSE